MTLKFILGARGYSESGARLGPSGAILPPRLRLPWGLWGGKKEKSLGVACLEFFSGAFCFVCIQLLQRPLSPLPLGPFDVEHTLEPGNAEGKERKLPCGCGAKGNSWGCAGFSPSPKARCHVGYSHYLSPRHVTNIQLCLQSCPFSTLEFHLRPRCLRSRRHGLHHLLLCGAWQLRARLQIRSLVTKDFLGSCSLPVTRLRQ